MMFCSLLLFSFNFLFFSESFSSLMYDNIYMQIVFYSPNKSICLDNKYTIFYKMGLWLMWNVLACWNFLCKLFSNPEKHNFSQVSYNLNDSRNTKIVEYVIWNTEIVINISFSFYTFFEKKQKDLVFSTLVIF